MTYTCISNPKVYHFADDTNLLHINSCITKGYKKININYDLKRLTNWLDANMIPYCTKTEPTYFRKRSATPTNNKIKLNGKRLIPTDHIKYLGVYLMKLLVVLLIMIYY